MLYYHIVSRRKGLCAMSNNRERFRRTMLTTNCPVYFKPGRLQWGLSLIHGTCTYLTSGTCRWWRFNSRSWNGDVVRTGSLKSLLYSNNKPYFASCTKFRLHYTQHGLRAAGWLILDYFCVPAVHKDLHILMCCINVLALHYRRITRRLIMCLTSVRCCEKHRFKSFLVTD